MNHRHARLYAVTALLAATVTASVACGESDEVPPAPSASDASVSETASPADSGGSDTATTSDSASVDAAPSDAAPSDAGSDTADATDAPNDAQDAGDAPALTNNSLWEASSGLTPQQACVTWTLTKPTDAGVPALASGALPIATSIDADNLYFRQGATEVITPAQLNIEATMRLIAGSASTPSRAPANIVFRYGSPLRKNGLFIASGEVFLLSSENVKGPTATVATTDAFHDYRITVNTATHAIEVFRDSVSVLTGAAYLESDTSAEADISFGEGSNFANGTSHWQRVLHNAHVLGPCP